MKLPKFLRFGMKSAKRKTWDYSYHNNKLPNQDSGTVSKLKDYAVNDPDLAAGIRKFVDNCLIECPKIIKSAKSKVSDSTVDKYNESLRDVRFYKIIRNGYFSLIMFSLKPPQF